MKRAPIVLLFALAAVAIIAYPSTASAIPVHVHETVEVVGGVEVEEVDVQHVAPKDSDEDGFKDAADECPQEPFSTNGGCKPEPVAVPVTESVAPAPVETSVATDSGGYSIPSDIVMCESGGDYTASNPSGAYGAYQIMPGTASAYGCDLSTASGQDQCAAEIWADAGSSAWVCG